MNEKGKRIQRALGGIGDDLLDEAAGESGKSNKTKTKTKRFKILLIAAALAVILTAGTVLTVSLIKQAVVINDPPAANGLVFSGSAYMTDGIVELPECLRSINVTADGAPGRILPVSGSLIIETSGECDAEILTKYVTVTPQIPMAVKKLASNRFSLTPASGGFVAGTVYRVTLGDAENPASSYAFQTETGLFVKSILPADKAVNVPVDTGIEICFSDSVAVCTFSEYITVSPKISGEFMLYEDGRTVAFVPKDKLAENTVYTVTVAPGITGVSGKQSAQSRTAMFRTASPSAVESKINVNVSDSFPVFARGTEAYVKLTNYGEKGTKYTVTAGLYRYQSSSAAVLAMSDHESRLGDFSFDTKLMYSVNGLTPVNTVTQSGSIDRYSSDIYCYFGTGLDYGTYLCNITVKTDDAKYQDTCQVILQVSDLRVFNISSDGETLVWVNRTDGSPASGAIVGCETFDRVDLWNNDGVGKGDTFSGTIDSDGMFRYSNGEHNSAFLTVTLGEDSQVVCVSSQTVDTGYYTMKYIYTDREVYFSDDTVNFSGFISIPYDSGKLPDTLYLRTGNSSLRQRIDVNPDGSFTGCFKIESYGGYGFYLSLENPDGVSVVSKYIRVTQEKKPVTKVNITFDKLFYRYSEPIKVTITATFYDGTPVSGAQFSVRDNLFGFSGSYTTGQDGTVSFTVKPKAVSASSTGALFERISAELIGMETETLTLSSEVPYFHSDYIYGMEYGINSRRLTLNALDTSKLTDAQSLEYPAYPDNTVGAPADGGVQYSLIRYVITKTAETGYDKINKRTYTYYTYSRATYTDKSGTFSFSDGVIDLPMYTVIGFSGGYYYDLSYSDGRNTYKSTINATVSSYAYYTDNSAKSELSVSKDSFSVGDTIEASFLTNGEPQKALFAMFADGLYDCSVGNAYSSVFDRVMIPGARLYGVIFDTATLKYKTLCADIKYDFLNNSTLDITLSAGSGIFKPGETATVKIKVNGVTGGTVLLSVVDEACFALGEQNADIASAYFSSLGSASLKSYYSYYGYAVADIHYQSYYSGLSSSIKPVIINGCFIPLSRFSFSELYYGETKDSATSAQPESVAEPGSSADNRQSNGYYIRKYFADNPEFSLVTLDGNGEGVLTFTVPDNITEWRITASAVSGLGGAAADVKVGNAVSDIVCTLPFFINPGICDRYTVGDDIAFSARVYGNSVTGKAVSYTATLYSETGTAVADAKLSSTAGEFAWFRFGKQEAGSFTVEITADCGGYSDGVRQTFSVTESGIVMDVRRDITAAEIKTLSPLVYPVTLSFYDKSASYGCYNSAVRSVLLTGSDRADALAARYIALIASEKLYGTETSEDTATIKEKLAGYENNGYLSLLYYSEGDIELTARILASVPDVISSSKREEISARLDKLVSSGKFTDKNELCAALLGLASMGEPVLDRLYSVASVAGDYPLEAKLYLCAAFAAIGDYSGAADIYSVLKAEYGVADEEYGTLYINGGNTDTNARLTSLALLTAARISKADAEKLASYLIGNRSESELNVTGLAAYIRFFMPTGEVSEKSLSYRIGDGESKAAVIRAGRILSLRLTKSELESLVIENIDNGIGIRAAYGGTAREALGADTESSRVSISKRIDKLRDNMYIVTLTVSGTSTRTHEWFEINDCIPSGARYYSMYSNGNGYSNGQIYTYAEIYNRSGQNMNGYVSIGRKDMWRQNTCPEYSFSVTLQYVIRGAVEGTFICEAAVIRNRGTGIYSISDSFDITVKETGAWIVSDNKHSY